MTGRKPERALDDPATLARAAMIVRAALERQPPILPDLDAEPGGDGQAGAV
jgi:hypothetical protein